MSHKTVQKIFNLPLWIVPQCYHEPNLSTKRCLKYGKNPSNLLLCNTRIDWKNKKQLTRHELDLNSINSLTELKQQIEECHSEGQGKNYLIGIAVYTAQTKATKKKRTKKGRPRNISYRKKFGGIEVLIAFQMMNGKIIKWFLKKKRPTRYAPRHKKIYPLAQIYSRKQALMRGGKPRIINRKKFI